MLIPRQKKLLSILVNDKNRHDFLGISAKLNCSIKTVQRDLQVIKDTLPAEWNIDICRGKGVILYKPAHSSSMELEYMYIRRSIPFQIIDRLFQSNIRTLAELASELYIPITSLSIHLNKIEQYFKKFGVILKRKPLSIHGKSADIMFLYQEIYTYSYGDHEWAFQQINEKKLQEYIMKIEKK